MEHCIFTYGERTSQAHAVNIKCLVQKNAIWDTSCIADSSLNCHSSAVNPSVLSRVKSKIFAIKLYMRIILVCFPVRGVVSAFAKHCLNFSFLALRQFSFFPSPQILPEPLKVIQISQVVFRITV